MKHHFCRRQNLLELNMQSLEREKLDPNGQKLPQHHRQILDISELVMSTGSSRKRQHTAYGAIGYKLGRNNIIEYHCVIRTDIECI